MKKIKKTLLIVLSLVLVSALSVVGTVAYLTSQDSDVNVMTLGNVKIEQHEYERVVNEDGTYKKDTIDDQTSYVLQEFTQAKPLLPIVGNPDDGYDSTTVRLGQLGHNSRGGMDVLPEPNVQDKFVVVENTGKTDAYVRTIVAFEAGSVVEEDWYKIVDYSSHFTWKETQDWFVTEIDGNNYYLVEFVYNGYEDIQHPNGVLTPGDYTYNSLAQVYLKSNATNEDCEALDGNGNGTLDILVISQAAQTAGFADAKTALDTAFGEFNKENVAEWFKGVVYEHNTDTWDSELDKSWFDAEAAANATAENPVTFTVDTAEEFAGFVKLANTNSFQNVIVKLDCDIDLGGTNWNEGGAIAAYGSAFNGTLDGNGHTIYNLTAENSWSYANALFRTIGNDVTIKNLTIEGANINNAAASSNNKEYGILVGIVGSGTLTIEDVTIRNSSVSCKTSAGILVGGMTEGAIHCKNVVMENCDVSVTNATGKGGAILGDGWSAHDYDYAGIYTDNVKVINCTYTVAGVQQAELPLYNYVK